MSKIVKVILVIMLVGFLITGCSGGSNQESMALGRITSCSTDSAQSPQIDYPAPDFQFQNPDGQPISLSDLQGKPVLINFWQVRCPPCRMEMPYLQQVYEQWSDKGLMVLAINIGESSAKVEAFMQSNDLSLPVLLDTNQDTAQGYNIQYIPSTFFIDKDGIIQEKIVGAFPSKIAIEEKLSKIIT
jgi:thiol-disulfide isomerase/thioredoxin